jgi:hypothetical protein
MQLLKDTFLRKVESARRVAKFSLPDMKFGANIFV